MNAFLVKLLTPSAQLPVRGSALAAGLDVRADLLDADGKPRVLKAGRDRTIPVAKRPVEGGYDYGFTLHPGKRVLIPTGIAVSVSPDVYVRAAPRSGLALNDGIDVLAGVIDADYRGECGIILINTDDEYPVVITQGMRVAQIILERVSLENPTLVDELPAPGDRGAAGFGSTGAR